MTALKDRFGVGAPTIRVHLIIRGRIGLGWMDVDEQIRLPEGATLRALLDTAEQRGIAVRSAIRSSPHLADTLMVNGERCPVDREDEQVLTDGDQVYLLAPLAGG